MVCISALFRFFGVGKIRTAIAHADIGCIEA